MPATHTHTCTHTHTKLYNFNIKHTGTDKNYTQKVAVHAKRAHTKVIGSNCPGISGTVPDYKNLSRVPER